MYEDFRCPNCRNFEAVNNTYVNSLVRAGKIEAVYHPMHFIAPDSQLTAAAAACAADQGKFLEMHTALYVNQPTTAQAAENSAYWTNAQLILLGHSIGITSKTFDTCINSGKYMNWANNINDDAASKNINATPTVIVNGKTLPLATDYDNKAFTKVLTALGVK
jgi:protein-disulfide isomerase